jgi:hypothetical protein
VDKTKVDEELKRIIAAKVTSAQNPWIKPVVVKTEALAGDGRLMEVSFEQNNLPQTALVGIYPDSKSYIFVFFSAQSLEFDGPRKFLVSYLKSLKIK